MKFYKDEYQTALRELFDGKSWYIQNLFTDRNVEEFQCYVAKSFGFKVCTHPKVGSKLWKKVFCELNGNSKCNIYGHNWHPDNVSEYDTVLDVADSTIARIVRDPLERLLSAYLDKCVDESQRTSGKHCLPIEITESKRWSKKQYNTSVSFHEWLDIMPNHWDEHVYPQCTEYFYVTTAAPDGIFFDMEKWQAEHRYHPQPYTHQIVLGRNYYQNVFNMVNSIKGLKANQREQVLKNFEEIKNTQTDRSAGRLRTLLQYYDRAAVARALKYYAVDYWCLDLPLPRWLTYIEE